MIKSYKFDYDFGNASIVFEVNTNKFTKEMALCTLDFFTWDWDKSKNPIDEVIKKYAFKGIQLATFNNHNTQGVIHDFEYEEGFAKVDGSLGIKLIDVEGYEFLESLLKFKS